MAHTIQRLTMYALLSALENDLRDFFSLHIAPGIQPSDRLPEFVARKAGERFSKENPESDPSLDDILLFVDLGDLISATRKHDEQLDSSTKRYISRFYVGLNGLIPIRNRVMHTRPLEYDDLPRVVNICDELERSNRSLWANIRTTQKLLERNPDFVVGLTIPEDLDESTQVLHNLPSSEFDDTGFMGRDKELSDLKNALVGPYPVITVVGEGGLGKTAIALKVCYDLLDDPAQVFDAIVWVTAKTTRLTANELQIIENAISSSLGLIESATNFLGRQSDEVLDDLLTHLRYNRVLLVVDNLETVIDQTLRDLASRIPSGSRLLFTTRIGLGAFDFPIPLFPLGPKEAAKYFRRAAKVWGATAMAELTQSEVEAYCSRLQSNPLFIKCFMQSVASGGRPSAIASNPDVLLQFCLQNVFSSLSPASKKVAGVLASINGPQSLASIAFYTELDSFSVQAALTYLMTSNLVSSERGRSSEDEDRYILSALARLYVQKFIRANPEEQRSLVRKQSILRSAQEEYSSRAGSDMFDFNFVYVRDKDDYIVARILTRAIESIFKEREDNAEALIKQAADLSPNYFEVHRVRAFFLLQQQDVYGAKAEYEAAISLAADRAPLRLWFGGFLSRSLDDKDGALEQFFLAERLAPEAEIVKLECARVLQYSRRFEEAAERLGSVKDLSRLPARTRRVHLDLVLKNNLKQADHLRGLQRFDEALELLEAAKKDFEEAPEGLIDHRTIRTLRQCLRMLSDLRRAFFGLPQANRLRSFEDWISRQTFKKHDTIADNADDRNRGSSEQSSQDSLVPNRGRLSQVHESYAFVVDTASRRLYFHQSQWSGISDFRRLPEGTILTYNVINNDDRLSASDVRPVDDQDIESLIGMQMLGTIKEVRPSFGFISLDIGRSIYFHRKDVAKLSHFLKFIIGQRVRCTFSRDDTGRIYASNVESYAGEK